MTEPVRTRRATPDDIDENGEPIRQDPDGTVVLHWEDYVDEYGYG